MGSEDGIVASALEVVEIGEIDSLDPRDGLFTPAENDYAASKVDPARRLAARLAAKRAAVELLGAPISPADIEVVRERGRAPRLRLSHAAEKRLKALGAVRTLVSLTHGETHAAASVLLLKP